MVAIHGHLDQPNEQSVVPPGGTLNVDGWVLFDGRPADRVELWFGDEEPRAGRRGLWRADVKAVVAPDAPTATVGRFHAVLPVPERLAGQVVRLHARAFSSAGDTWFSPAHLVQVDRARPAHDSGFDSDLASPRWTPDDAPHPLRLCVFTHSMNLGGGELYLDELLRRLKQHHEDLNILVVTGIGGPLIEPLRARGIAIHVTGGYRVHPHAYASGRRELQLVMAAWRPDVVLANTLGVFPAVDAAVDLGLPVIWALHESFELEEYITLNWGSAGLAEPVEARMRLALTSAYTVFEAQATLEQYARQLPAMRARQIPYGVDVAAIDRYRTEHDRQALRTELGFADDEFVILCMGAFQERKAQAALVLAFHEIANLFPRAHLVLVGYFPSNYGQHVEQIIDELGLRSRVSSLPIQADIYRWYSVADVLVSASDIESLPRSILEAKAFGLPTLATDVFGLPEIITDGVDGWLCRPSSGNALTAGLFRVLSTSSTEVTAMRAACLAEAPQYDGAGYGAAYFTFATELAETHRLGTPQEETPAHG